MALLLSFHIPKMWFVIQNKSYFCVPYPGVNPLYTSLHVYSHVIKLWMLKSCLWIFPDFALWLFPKQCSIHPHCDIKSIFYLGIFLRNLCINEILKKPTKIFIKYVILHVSFYLNRTVAHIYQPLSTYRNSFLFRSLQYFGKRHTLI